MNKLIGGSQGSTFRFLLNLQRVSFRQTGVTSESNQIAMGCVFLIIMVNFFIKFLKIFEFRN